MCCVPAVHDQRTIEEQLVKANAISIPSNGGATSAITDPTLQKVLTYLQGVSYNQLYFDQALPTNVGNAVNDAVSNFFAGQGSSQDIADAAGKAEPVTALSDCVASDGVVSN